MSHELKTPLNSINVISSIMMKNTKKLLNEEQVKNLNIINNCGNDLLYLINDVLDVSKLEAGKIELVNETFNLKDTIGSMYNMFLPQMKEKNINFIYNYDDTINFIYSDEQRIKQVIKNLLSNALKFAQNGTVNLNIQDDKENVKFIVKDDGIGISKNKLGNIFDRFKQVDGSTSRKYGGSGLGLTICKELSSLLDGKIEVQSEENQGAIFIVTISKHSEKIEVSDAQELKSIQHKNTETISYQNEEIQKPIVKTTNKEKNETNINNTILLFNNDPINFIKLTIELKKSFTIIQSNNHTKFLEDFKNNKDILTAIIDTTSMKTDIVNKLLDALPIKFILIVKEDENIEHEKILYRSKKPLEIEEIIKHIQNQTKEPNE